MLSALRAYVRVCVDTADARGGQHDINALGLGVRQD